MDARGEFVLQDTTERSAHLATAFRYQGVVDHLLGAFSEVAILVRTFDVHCWFVHERRRPQDLKLYLWMKYSSGRRQDRPGG